MRFPTKVAAEPFCFLPIRTPVHQPGLETGMAWLGFWRQATSLRVLCWGSFGGGCGDPVATKDMTTDALYSAVVLPTIVAQTVSLYNALQAKVSQLLSAI